MSCALYVPITYMQPIKSYHVKREKRILHVQTPCRDVTAKDLSTWNCNLTAPTVDGWFLSTRLLRMCLYQIHANVQFPRCTDQRGIQNHSSILT